jgi:hypothetical protein
MAGVIGTDSFTQSLYQSAGTFAAIQTAARLTPAQAAIAGQVYGAARALQEFFTGNATDIPLPLLGGISLNQARQLYNRAATTPYARKNFWILKFAPLDQSNPAASADVNLLATEVSYGSTTLSSESRHFGSTFIDEIQASERTELKVTTLDDTYGTIKRWFNSLTDKVASNDGAYGVPYAYALRTYLTHGFVEGYDQGIALPSAPGQPAPYVDVLLLRPSTMEIELSRRDSGLQEVQLGFVEIDPFMA